MPLPAEVPSHQEFEHEHPDALWGRRMARRQAQAEMRYCERSAAMTQALECQIAAGSAALPPVEVDVKGARKVSRLLLFLAQFGLRGGI